MLAFMAGLFEGKGGKLERAWLPALHASVTPSRRENKGRGPRWSNTLSPSKQKDYFYIDSGENVHKNLAFGSASYLQDSGKGSKGLHFSISVWMRVLMLCQYLGLRTNLLGGSEMMKPGVGKLVFPPQGHTPKDPPWSPLLPPHFMGGGGWHAIFHILEQSFSNFNAPTNPPGVFLKWQILQVWGGTRD